jgi:hypothetical protein
MIFYLGASLSNKGVCRKAAGKAKEKLRYNILLSEDVSY